MFIINKFFISHSLFKIITLNKWQLFSAKSYLSSAIDVNGMNWFEAYFDVTFYL